MTKIATRETKLGNLVKFEQSPHSGIARSVATVTFVEGMEIGQVLQSDDSGATWTGVAKADVATLPADVAVLIDSTVYDGLAAGAADLAVLKGDGDVIVAREQLKFLDTLTSGEVDTVVAALEAKRIQVGKQV